MARDHKVGLRLTDEQLAQLDALVPKLQQARPAYRITRHTAGLEAFLAGLATLTKQYSKAEAK